MEEAGAKVDVRTPFQRQMMEVHGKAVRELLNQGHRIINSDEMVDSTNMTPHLEVFNDDLGVYFYSIDLTFRGERINRALFAGQLMMVAAANQEQAKALAADGLLSTVNLMYEEVITRPQREMQTDLGGEGLIIDLSGRKIQSEKPVDPVFAEKLTNMLASKTKH